MQSLSSLWRSSSIYILVVFCFISSSRLSTALCTTSTRLGKFRQTSRLKMAALEIGKEGYTTSNFENPPFFPSTVEELAYDVAFATKIAMINRIKRIRVDIRLRLTSRDRYMLKWLLMTSINLLDDDDSDSNVHVFIDKSDDVLRCQDIWTEIVKNCTDTDSAMSNFGWLNTESVSELDMEKKNKELKEKKILLNKLSKIHISPISDVHLQEKDSVLVIFNPDNMHSCEHPDLLEDVQALCFHAALRNIPVVLINPQLIATAWNDFGARTPLLLSDFAQAYFICDDYFMFSKRDQWCGIIQRAASGFDLFLLEGFPSIGGTFPKRYTRLQNWPNGMPHDIKSYLRQLLTRDPNFPLKEIFDAEDLVNHGIRDLCYSADGKAYNNGDFKMKNYDDTSIVLNIEEKKIKKIDAKSGWRNIVPAPPSRRSPPPNSVKSSSSSTINNLKLK